MVLLLLLLLVLLLLVQLLLLVLLRVLLLLVQLLPVLLLVLLVLVLLLALLLVLLLVLLALQVLGCCRYCCWRPGGVFGVYLYRRRLRRITDAHCPLVKRLCGQTLGPSWAKLSDYRFPQPL